MLSDIVRYWVDRSWKVETDGSGENHFTENVIIQLKCKRVEGIRGDFRNNKQCLQEHETHRQVYVQKTVKFVPFDATFLKPWKIYLSLSQPIQGVREAQIFEDKNDWNVDK